MDQVFLEAIVDRVRQGKICQSILVIADRENALRSLCQSLFDSIYSGKTPAQCSNFFHLSPLNKMRQIAISAIRELRFRLSQMPQGGDIRFVWIESADRLHRFAANGLLKILEEPPPATLFLLTTTRPYVLPSTIYSRCLPYRLARARNLEPARSTQWTECLSELRRFFESLWERFSPRYYLEYPLLIDHFRCVLDNLPAPTFSPDLILSTDLATSLFRQEQREILLADWGQILLEVSLPWLGDGSERRFAVNVISGAFSALERCGRHMELKCNEAAALDGFFLTLLDFMTDFHELSEERVVGR